MSKDIELQIEVRYGDIEIERIISSKTTIRIATNDHNIELTPHQVIELHKALNAYVKADIED